MILSPIINYNYSYIFMYIYSPYQGVSFVLHAPLLNDIVPPWAITTEQME